MSGHPRILSLAAVQPPNDYPQSAVLACAQDRTLGPGWRDDPQGRERGRQMERLFAATRVERRQSVLDLADYYAVARSTGQRMATYREAAHDLGRAALSACLNAAAGRRAPDEITDFTAVSCTGYSAPGLDVTVARAQGLRRDVRRSVVGHMGCFGSLVGLRQSLDALRARPTATAALLSVELSTLHFAPSLDPEPLTSFALFGDAAAALLLAYDEAARGPELVDAYSAADFEAMGQMSWTIGDEGFAMTLSPRVPVSLRRVVRGVVERLLEPHGIAVSDVAHWVVHPGGPSILDVVQARLELSDDQMAPSWKVLRDHGNCSSTTVLLILDEILRSGRAQPGEWGVMLAFGPGLTVETVLLRF